MATGLIDIIKRASIDAEDNQQPCDIRFGTVASVSPLKVKITNEFILPQSLLIVPEHLTDHVISVTMNLSTSTVDEHSHEIHGTKTMTVHNALKKGDKVALLRKRGGQSYYILDRI